MLEPNQRQQFLQAFRPPEGYDLSFVIGTTYSLDLTALLNIPLAIAQFDWEDQDGRPTADPLAMLEALRRYADRLHIFCQSGCIAVPEKQSLLFEYLENSVFQVNAPLGGVFHPKVWVLRFAAPDEPVIYRFLCMSRNLTFDRSWDTILILEGEFVDRQKAYAAHHPLGDFIQALPKLAQTPLPDQVQANIELAQYELRRANFITPEGFSHYGFWPMGIEGYTNQWPFSRNYDRMLVVSPFLSAELLEGITEQGNGHVLMSRLDSLSSLRPEDLAGYKKVFSLSPMVDIEEPDTDSIETAFFETALSGLHAKLYVADAGWDAHIWTGSANATNAAFNRNVEFLVELVGKKSVCGVNVFLESTKEQSKFADLWLEYQPLAESPESDPVQEQLEESLREAQKTLIQANWHGQVYPSSTPDEFFLQILPGTAFSEIPNIEIQYRPLTLSALQAITYNMQGVSEVMFAPIAMESITTFVVFHLKAQKGDRSSSLQFVQNIPLLGVPETRREQMLRFMLKNRNQVMRFLLFILADGQNDAIHEGMEMGNLIENELGAREQNHQLEIPLFEALVHTLHRDPKRLDQIARTVAELEGSSDGKELLPPEFHRIWLPIWEARQKISL